jgi:hypothetical protein
LGLGLGLGLGAGATVWARLDKPVIHKPLFGVRVRGNASSKNTLLGAGVVKLESRFSNLAMS